MLHHAMEATSRIGGVTTFNTRDSILLPTLTNCQYAIIFHPNVTIVSRNTNTANRK